MKIILSTDSGSIFAICRTWDAANTAARAIFKRNYWSDICYRIQFDNGEISSGNIDLEPKSYWTREKNILTSHLRTFWGNVIKKNPSYIPESAKTQFKNWINFLPKN